MRPSPRCHRRSYLALIVAVAVGVLGCAGTHEEATAPTSLGETLKFTPAQIASLDSTAQEIARTNSTNPDLTALVDSTLMVFTAGVEAKRIDVSTDLTSAPLYFVGIHRAVTQPRGSYSTWTVVALDDPSRLASLIEVSGFAQDSLSVAPTSVTGTIGDGRGIGNALLLQVAAGGVVTTWRANTGTVSFSSSVAGAACPGFTARPLVSCALETMHVRFTVSAPSSGGRGTRQASVVTEVDVPTMRLTYTR